ncbi:hypothetical protein I4F81_005488 [Pyropia yezoensis]|uniref:Uncharacterized protein n=1 Tax=Pyropia yezoensis TaxID=2788 RepID=A0ACC3BYE3_PYRYE|nr:hypothetical protein I4F81_005488 [Neopyropia yezoensis]
MDPTMDCSTMQSTVHPVELRGFRPSDVEGLRSQHPSRSATSSLDAREDDRTANAAFEVQPVDTLWSSSALRLGVDEGAVAHGIDLPNASPQPLQDGARTSSSLYGGVNNIGDPARVVSREPTDD